MRKRRTDFDKCDLYAFLLMCTAISCSGRGSLVLAHLVLGSTALGEDVYQRAYIALTIRVRVPLFPSSSRTDRSPQGRKGPHCAGGEGTGGTSTLV